MVVKRETIHYTNRFGDKVSYEIEVMSYEDEDERRRGMKYNYTHADKYSDYIRRNMAQNLRNVAMDDIMESFAEFRRTMEFD